MLEPGFDPRPGAGRPGIEAGNLRAPHTAGMAKQGIESKKSGRRFVAFRYMKNITRLQVSDLFRCNDQRPMFWTLNKGDMEQETILPYGSCARGVKTRSLGNPLKHRWLNVEDYGRRAATFGKVKAFHYNRAKCDVYDLERNEHLVDENGSTKWVSNGYSFSIAIFRYPERVPH